MEMDASWGDMASHFMVYFRVEDCDASAAKVAELGGEVCVPPTEIPPGKFSVVNDSLGSTFSIMSLRDLWSNHYMATRRAEPHFDASKATTQ